MSPHPPNPRVTALEIVWRNVWVRALAYVGLAVFVVWALWVLRAQYAFALQVGLIGFVIAYILNPVVVLLQRLRLPRAVAVVIVYVLLLQLLVIGSVLISQVVGQLTLFVTQIPETLQSAGNTFAQLAAWFQLQLDNLPGFMRNLGGRIGVDFGPDEQLTVDVQQRLQEILQQAVGALTGVLRDLVERGPAILVTGATSIISATLQLILILLASAYFLYDFPKFTANFRRFVPLRWRGLYNDLADKTDRSVGGYLRGQLLITVILGLLIWLGLSIIGVPLALAISFLAAIFNLVPYLGPIIGVVPAVLLGFTVSPLTALLAVGVFFVANQLEGNILSPIILSRSVNLHPVTVLIAIMVGLGLLGFVGALLAVPAVALTKILLEDYLLTRPAYRPPGPDDPDASGEPLSPADRPERAPAGSDELERGAEPGTQPDTRPEVGGVERQPNDQPL